MKGEEALITGDVWVLDNIETSSGRQRVADIIVHAVENGYMWQFMLIHDHTHSHIKCLNSLERIVYMYMCI